MVLRFGTALLVLALAAVPAAAQDPASPAADTAAGAPSCEDGTDCPVLTLDRFRRQVARTNPEVRSFRLEGDRAVAELQGARGGFDPRLVSGYTYKTENSATKLDVLNTGLRLPLNLPMSPSLKVDYRRGRGKSIDPSVATTFDGETAVGLSIAPLRGFGLGKRQATLRKARLEPERARALQAEQRNLLLLEATQAYWKWVEASRKLAVARDQLALATRRRDLIVRQAETGQAAAIDSTEAELAVASRRESVAAAVQDTEQAAAKLAAFLGGEDGPAGPPPDFAFSAPDSVGLPPPVGEAEIEGAEAAAVSNRPRLRRLDVKRRQTRIEQDLARANLRPDFKLETQVVSYEDGPFDVSDVKVGFEIEQPLFFRGSRSRVERARLETRQAELKQQAVRQKVRADVQAAVSALRQARRRVRATERRVDLARRLQAAEQRRFELGESTLFLLNQREQALAKARKARVTARADVRRALARFQWATGRIAEALPRALR
jgi:outer membrane protein TolC